MGIAGGDLQLRKIALGGCLRACGFVAGRGFAVALAESTAVDAGDIALLISKGT